MEAVIYGTQHGITFAGYYNDLHTQRGWRGYLPLAVRYILALVLLIVLDAIWMQLIAKYALGIDYFAIVQDIQVR